MIRVHVVCEGHTEEMFVNELLAAPIGAQGVLLLPAKIGRPGHKGGNVNFPRLLVDIRERLLRDNTCYCTTLLDYYGLPADFPGKAAATGCKSSHDKLGSIADALSAQMTRALGDAARRFLHYVQIHEFEGLLFSQPELLAQSLQQPALAETFIKIRNGFARPEDIDDGPNTAPSKRIEQLFPAYDKPLHPLLAAREIGLDIIRRECPLFDGWVRRLETLAGVRSLR